MCLGDVLEKINFRADGKKKNFHLEKKKCRHFEWKNEKKIITLPQSDYEDHWCISKYTLQNDLK